jgi:hypothetical protein
MDEKKRMDEKRLKRLKRPKRLKRLKRPKLGGCSRD